MFPRDSGWLRLFPVTLLAMGGCITSPPELSRYSLHRLELVGDADLMGRVRAVLVSEGFVVDRVDPSSGAIFTLPKQTTSVAESLPSRGLSGAPRLLRRIARVRIVERPDAASLFCRVELQEQVTETHRLFRLERRGSDTPVGTAIDRDAGSTNEQNTVWKTLRRDKVAERRILNAIAQEKPGG